MRPRDRAVARKNLDKKLNFLRDSAISVRPARGWIKAIREALGMTTAQLGRRMGVSQPRAVAIEKAEISGKITVESLERAADALGCRLVYALVPQQSLESLVEGRARLLAEKHMSSVAHSMALEDQGVEAKDSRAQLERLIDKILHAPGSKLWESE